MRATVILPVTPVWVHWTGKNTALRWLDARTLRDRVVSQASQQHWIPCLVAVIRQKLWCTDVLELNFVSVIRSAHTITCSGAGHKINHTRKSFRTKTQQLYTGEPRKIAWANGELSCAQ